MTAPPRPAPLHRLRQIVWILVIVAALAFAWLLWFRPTGQSLQSQPRPTDGSAVAFGGPFSLTDANGQRFASSRRAGKPYVMFFGFTHCPDVCPTTLARLSRLRSRAGGPAALTIVFVSVDPQRDTPTALKEYAALYDTPIVMLTGTPVEIAKVEKQHGIFAARVAEKNAPDGYTMDHSAAALVFDKAGNFTSTIAPDEPDSSALAKLERVTA